MCTGDWCWEETGFDLGLYCARRPTWPILTHSVLQVATAHPLRAEEPHPRPHPSHPTLYLHRLEASPRHRASHRATAPRHNSVSAAPAEQTEHASCHPILLGRVATLCICLPGLAEFMGSFLHAGLGQWCLGTRPSVCGRTLERS